MQRRKRAPGGGRKLRDDSRLDKVKGVRLSIEQLDRLERSRSRRSKRLGREVSVSEEISNRINASYGVDPDGSLEPKLLRLVRAEIRLLRDELQKIYSMVEKKS